MSAPLPTGTRPVIVLVRTYQRWISPFFGARCRFFPSCSAYTVQALAGHGFWRGGRLAVWRVLRCQPFSAGGPDSVPPPPARSRRASTLVSPPPTGAPQ